MDAQRTSFTLIIAALLAGTALAEPPSQSAPVRYSGNDWSSGGTTPAPTIKASPDNRYAYPPSAYPQSTSPVASQPQSMTGRAQNAFNETANTLRDGINNGVRSAGNSINSAAQQALGTAGYPLQSTNPFTTQPAAPPASSTTRNLAPPPWPTNSGTPATPPASNWPSPTPVTPVDRSVLASPPAPQISSGWTSIGSTVAAPPMLLPKLTVSGNSLAPLNTTVFDGGPSFTTDSYRNAQPSFNTSPNTTPPSSPPVTPRTSPTADNWAATWDAGADPNKASIGGSANNSSRPVANSNSDFPATQRGGTSPPDTRSTAAKPADSWIDDSWSRNSQSPNSAGASIAASKTAGIGFAGDAPGIQSPVNAPPANPPVVTSAGNNTTFGGMNTNAVQQPQTVNAAKPAQAATATGEPQPWMTLLVVILGLAGSLAGNIYLAWSYMDARQKYQALVRRTADTFRRTKSVAA